MDRPGCLADFFLCNRRAAKGDIALNISGEKEHVLLYLPDSGPECVSINFTDVYPVNKNFPLLDIIISPNQIQNGGFPCAGCAHKGNFFTGAYKEAYIF